MDKRTALFIICTSLAFFGIQYWFGAQNAAERQSWEQAQSQKMAREKAELETQIAKRRASLSDLPLTPFYANEESEEKIATAAISQNGILALAWTDRLPSSVYVPDLGTLELATKSHRLGEPVIYAKGKPKVLEAPPLSLDAPTDLQLLSASRIVVGQQRGDAFDLPFESLEENAIAFIKHKGSYAPVGVFDASAKKIRLLCDYDRLKTLVQQTKIAPSAQPESGEQFYVLENEYQQLVFSTRGGAIAEINLPIRSPENQKSIVKAIEPDRLILEQSPQNGRFPLFPAFAIDENGQRISRESKDGGYYPLIRRTQIGSDGTIKTPIDPQYYAMNLVADDSDLASLQYRVTRFEKNLIQFEASEARRSIVKTFTIPEERNGPYCFEMEIRIDGDAKGVWAVSGIPEVELLSGSFSPLLRLQITHGKSSDVETIDLSDKNPVMTVASINPNWISNSNGFLGIIFDPLDKIGEGYRAAKIGGALVPTRLSLIDASHNLYPVADYPGYATYLPMKSGENLKFRIIASPFDESLLKELDDFYDEPLDNYNPDYLSAQSIQGWFSFISQPFAKFLSLLLQMFYAVTSSWGFSIILLTIALRLMMYPLNNWSIRSTVKMQEIAPKIKAIQERHKKDPKKGQMEIMNLYRQQGINPFSGCFPILLQMPFLIGMFYLLKSTFPLRGAVFIPGWINNLAAPDVLFSWDTPIFLIGTQFHLLPILLGLTMFIQQRMTSKIPKDAKDLSDSQKQQKMMGNMMSIVFTVMFYSFPSGLNIYFISSTLLGVLQQWYLTKKIKAEPTKPELLVKPKK